MITQKQIAQALDRAADRAEIVDAAPATAKQVWFLAGLIAKSEGAEADYNGWLLNTSAVLTKAEASSLITFYLGR